jgi:hypothetical protein
MDDLVVAGALGLTGLYLLAVILLFAIYSGARLMYSSFLAGNSGVVLEGIAGTLIIISVYLAIGFWLRKTDYI